MSRQQASATVEVLINFSGIVHQAWFPSCHVLLLSLQHDCCPYPGRIALKGQRRMTKTTSIGVLLVHVSKEKAS